MKFSQTYSQRHFLPPQAPTPHKFTLFAKMNFFSQLGHWWKIHSTQEVTNLPSSYKFLPKQQDVITLITALFTSILWMYSL